MIRKDYKALKLSLVAVLALWVTWQGKNNFAGAVNVMTDNNCRASMLLIKCKSHN